MAARYEAIANDRDRLQRTATNSIRTLSALYADRTHFIFELLQNTEDSLRRRPDGWLGSRAAKFALSEQCLRLTHFGRPFDEVDVQAICSVGETTKELTDIGRFGIGFKSVYAFTERPEVHSGDEDFAIEDFVRPVSMSFIERGADETIILIPRKPSDRDFGCEIAAGLQRLGAGTLLFLREIEEIEWHVAGGPSGLYRRRAPDRLAEGARRITVIGQEQGKAEIEETWLVFSKAVGNEGAIVGHVEIAFSITEAEAPDDSIEPITESPLVAFFPTVLSTHLGFLVQGPYRTTPSRDNVPRGEPWNQHLVRETAALLGEALRWLRDHGLLNTAALRCLPLDRARFGETNMFAPLFEATRQALKSEPLLPRFDSGHVAAGNARIAGTQELRDLISPSQLGALSGHMGELVWLSADITQARTPELIRYLMQELDIAVMTPETILAKLDEAFLRAQPDAWILDLYHFLNGQSALRRRLEELPLIRLEDGKHVKAKVNGQPQAFLPGAIKTGFPTVRGSVCATEIARGFLLALGLTEPDPVDDVVRNVLPMYRPGEVDVSTADYEADIRRILTAFGTDSKGQREKLLAALRETAFVMAVDAGDGSKRVSKPGDLYLATDRLKDLFSGVADVLLVNDAYACLRGEDVRELLEASGAARYLKPIPVDPGFTWEQRRELRRQAGHERTSRQNDSFDDWSLAGFDRLLGAMLALNAESAATKAMFLWEALGDVETRRGHSVFTGSYRWTHRGSYSCEYPSSFVRRLNETAWVPGATGHLERPEFVDFETLGWKLDPFLQSKICFKPPIIEALAKEAGIEPGVLDLLKKLGLTSEAELRNRLGMKGEPAQAGDGSPDPLNDALKSLGVVPDPSPAVPDPSRPEYSGSGGRGGATGAGSVQGTGGSSGGQSAGRGDGSEPTTGKRTPGGAGGPPFISYVGVHPGEEEADPDGLDQLARMALEARAIDLILAHEPQWQRTNTHNPGFDLFQTDEDGAATRWCEVKAMTGALRDRPVGLSRTQFECAREHGDAYWLYVVEHTGTDSVRIVPVQDPAGKARTFTFDHGWLGIADITGAADVAQDDVEP